MKQTNYLHLEVDIIKTFLSYKNLRTQVQLKLLPPTSRPHMLC